MAASRVAHRYSAALYRVALQQGSVDTVAADLRLVEATAHATPALLATMKAPGVSAERKRATLHGIFDAHLTQLLSRQFLDLLIDKGREEILAEAGTAYQEISDEAAGIVAVEVRSAVSLTDDQVTRLKGRLDSMTGKDTRLNPIVDPSLLGGVRVRIGDSILDGSVRGYLEQFGDRLRAIPAGSLLSDGGA